MLQLELLMKVILSLTKYNIKYMITGSIVSSIQGEPRSTHDIDMIIRVENVDVIKKLLFDFKQPDFYLDEYSIDEAIKDRSMFNLIDVMNGEKVDFWILTDSEFDKSRFSRKESITIDDLEINISSPEDTILAKLLWSKMSGGSKKQFIDAFRIYEIQKDILNISYIEKWAVSLDIKDLWDDIKKSN